MALVRVKIENYKSIKKCDITINDLSLLIGANGSGKSNVLSAITYFYDNLIYEKYDDKVYDLNNKFSNQVTITFYYDFTDFVKISKSNNPEFDFLNDDNEKSKYTDYYNAIRTLAEKDSNNIVSVKMSQIKGKPIKWNLPFESRLIIWSLFPVFYVDTRKLDITEWSVVWDTLGELGKVSNMERENLESSIRHIINDNLETKKKISSLQKIFDSAELTTVKYKSKDFAKNFAKIYLSGEKLYQRGKSLEYFSAGTNSVKYIELLLRTINEIAKIKMKHPIVLFDEPEISLHPSYIDELSEAILNDENRCRLIISTHSSRLAKNMLTGSRDISIFNIVLNGHYSFVKKMRNYSNYSPKSKYRVTDEHINAYFAKAILFVEGETELELFSNPFLKTLFPQLKNIDVYKAMAEAPVLDIMHPNKINTDIPYICLVDMDKIYLYDISKKKLSLRKEYFKGRKKEQLFFKNKHEKGIYLFHVYKRIEAMATKLKIHYYKPFYGCEDGNYKEFCNVLHEYFLNYNIFLASTTIEGMLINKRTMDLAVNFLKKNNKKVDCEEFEAIFNSYRKNDKMNLLRLLFNGKSDLLKSFKDITGNLTEEEKKCFEKMIIGEKTSGWVTDYLDSFCEELIPEKYSKDLKGFKRFINENDSNRLLVLNKFGFNFPELDYLIKKLCSMVG